MQALADQLISEIQKEKDALSKRETTLQEERDRFESEKLQMSAFKDSQEAAGEIIELNVGGEVMATKRGTLTQLKGSLLEAMFSGRWEKSVDLDSNGRVFLDFTPAVFRLLLSHLRVIRDSPNIDLIGFPLVPKEHSAEFNTMVRYLGLETLYRAPAQKVIELTSTNMYGISLLDGLVAYTNQSGHRPIIGATTILEGCIYSSWKVCVQGLSSGGWIFLGIISNESPEDKSYADPTCYGWAGGDQVYTAGQSTHRKQGWQSWQQGDEAIFNLDAKTGVLTMYLKRTGTRYALSLTCSSAVLESMRIHVNVYQMNTSLLLSQCLPEELQVLTGA